MTTDQLLERDLSQMVGDMPGYAGVLTASIRLFVTLTGYGPMGAVRV
jgi:hypothetical protein